MKEKLILLSVACLVCFFALIVMTGGGVAAQAGAGDESCVTASASGGRPCAVTPEGGCMSPGAPCGGWRNPKQCQTVPGKKLGEYTCRCIAP
jgi:hypothetical protein